MAAGECEWPPTSPQCSRQQAAEDLLWIIERFANRADMIGRSTYKALVAIFNRQCEVSEGKVVVKAKTGNDCIQNPSDADATYDAHEGRGRGHPLSGTGKRGWPLSALATGNCPTALRRMQSRNTGTTPSWLLTLTHGHVKPSIKSMRSESTRRSRNMPVIDLAFALGGSARQGLARDTRYG